MWLQAKKSERLEVKVKKMESALKAKEIERKLEKKLASDLDNDLNGSALSPAAWNRGRRPPFGGANLGAMIVIGLFLAVCGLACCKYTEGQWPVLPVPSRPTVPEEPVEWSSREKILARYATALENLIDGYNAEAKKHNEEHGYHD
jgi:hypothetical protein